VNFQEFEWNMLYYNSEAHASNKLQSLLIAGLFKHGDRNQLIAYRADIAVLWADRAVSK